MEIDYHVLAIVAGFIVMDIATGFCQACVNKTVDSTVLRLGLWHKSAYIFAIFLALLIEYSTLHMDLGFEVPLTIPVCCYIALTEIVSIVENLGRINPELMDSKLLDFFSLNRNRRNDDGNKNG